MKYHSLDISITSSGIAKQYHLFARSINQGEAKATTTIDPESVPTSGLLEHLDEQIISYETLFCRYLSLPKLFREIIFPGLFSFLAVIPKSTGLNTAPEKKVLREVERKLGLKIKVGFLKGPATPQAMRDALRDNDYHILHDAGHVCFNMTRRF